MHIGCIIDPSLYRPQVYMGKKSNHQRKKREIRSGDKLQFCLYLPWVIKSDAVQGLSYYTLFIIVCLFYIYILHSWCYLQAL